MTSPLRRRFEYVDGTVGLLIPGMETMLLDENGKEVGPDKPGDLLVKGTEFHISSLICRTQFDERIL
jgi:acyl-coenzyme A synthetase/AMP-(fatty) acid ligase